MITEIVSYYLFTYGGGRYTSAGYYRFKHEAEKERDRRIAVGTWAGKPPVVMSDKEWTEYRRTGKVPRQ